MDLTKKEIERYCRQMMIAGWDEDGQKRLKNSRVFIAGAGMSAALPGFIASLTTRPVIGIPIDSGLPGGIDALLSMVQMPPGLPVATVAVGKAGARNAAILAAEILGVFEDSIKDRLLGMREEWRKG